MNDAKIPGDGLITHTHELSEGYQTDCPVCSREVELTAGDLMVQLGLMIDPSFDQARKEIERAIKLIAKAREQLTQPLKFLGTPKVVDAVSHLDASTEALSELRQQFPRPSRSRIVQPLEFVMACYAEIYGKAPMASFRRVGGAEVPLGPGPKFIACVWARTHEMISQSKELKIEPRDSDGTVMKRAQFLTGDFRKAMREVLKRWDGQAPDPRILSPLGGNDSIWLG